MSYVNRQGFLTGDALTDGGGHQVPHVAYPDLSRAEMMAAVNHFYDSYYFGRGSSGASCVKPYGIGTIASASIRKRWPSCGCARKG